MRTQHAKFLWVLISACSLTGPSLAHARGFEEPAPGKVTLVEPSLSVMEAFLRQPALLDIQEIDLAKLKTTVSDEMVLRVILARNVLSGEKHAAVRITPIGQDLISRKKDFIDMGEMEELLKHCESLLAAFDTLAPASGQTKRYKLTLKIGTTFEVVAREDRKRFYITIGDNALPFDKPGFEQVVASLRLAQEQMRAFEKS